MGQRLQLHSLLKEILGSGNVYFQPPANVALAYPCIIYSRNKNPTKFANGKPYMSQIGYKVTVIDRNPDSLIPAKVAALPMCSFDRTYTADNLNHDIYNLYY